MFSKESQKTTAGDTLRMNDIGTAGCCSDREKGAVTAQWVGGNLESPVRETEGKRGNVLFVRKYHYS